MDLLGSILGSMTGPPSASEKEKAERKKAKEMAKKMEEKQREQSKAFRTKMEGKVTAFVKSKERSLTLPPMTKYERSVVHDVAEVAGTVVAHSFGVEDEDRHSVLWKKEDPPCDDELACLKSGKAWDPDQNERDKQEKLRLEILEEKELKERIKKNKKPFVPNKTNYREKYQHLIAAEATVEAVKAGGGLEKSFGLVSAEEKKDRRTMEQIQADIKAKRKAKEQLLAAAEDEDEGPTQPKVSRS